MKMLLAILSRDDELETVDELNKAQFFCDKAFDNRRFFRKKNTTILLGTEDECVQEAIEVIRSNAKNVQSCGARRRPSSPMAAWI